MDTGEIWKETRFKGYSISNLGRIRSEERVLMRSNGRLTTVPYRILKLNPDTKGYYQVKLYYLGKRTNVLVHRLVYETFAGSIPPLCDIDHIDGMVINNRLDNLQALTREQHANKTIQLMLKRSFDQGYQQALLDHKIKV